jgi:hypothetical protein
MLQAFSQAALASTASSCTTAAQLRATTPPTPPAQSLRHQQLCDLHFTQAQVLRKVHRRLRMQVGLPVHLQTQMPRQPAKEVVMVQSEMAAGQALSRVQSRSKLAWQTQLRCVAVLRRSNTSTQESKVKRDRVIMHTGHARRASILRVSAVHGFLTAVIISFSGQQFRTMPSKRCSFVLLRQ